MPWFPPTRTLLDPLPPQTLIVRQGDRLPAFACQVEDQDGVVVDLTGATAYMTLRPLRANVAQPAGFVRMPLTIESAVGGKVSYDWQHAETAAAPVSEYDVTIELEYSGGDKVTAPSASTSAIVSIRPTAAEGFLIDSNGRIFPSDLEFMP